MPNYVYKCTSCGQTVNIFHSLAEKSTDCELCGTENSLERDYSVPFNLGGATNQKQQRPGQIVDEFIEQTRKEIKEEKRNLKREQFND